MGKGSGRRPEAEAGAYASGWDAIFGVKAKSNPNLVEVENEPGRESDPEGEGPPERLA